MIESNGQINKIMLLFFIFIMLYGMNIFVREADKRNIEIDENNVHILFGDNLVNNSKEVTIKYDGDATKHIKEYSFDGGKNWTKSNIALVSEAANLKIQIKDINDKVYSLEKQKGNKMNIDKTHLLKISESNNALSDLYGYNSNSKFSYVAVMNNNSLNINSSVMCHSIIDLIDNKSELLSLAYKKI